MGVLEVARFGPMGDDGLMVLREEVVLCGSAGVDLTIGHHIRFVAAYGR